VEVVSAEHSDFPSQEQIENIFQDKTILIIFHNTVFTVFWSNKYCPGEHKTHTHTHTKATTNF